MLPSPSAEAKVKRLNPAVCYVLNCWRKMHSICSELKLLKLLSIIRAALQQFREPFLRGIRKKRYDEPKEDTMNVDSLWGSFTKTILRIFSNSNDNVLSRILCGFFRRGTFYEKLLLPGNTSSGQLLLQSN